MAEGGASLLFSALGCDALLFSFSTSCIEYFCLPQRLNLKFQPFFTLIFMGANSKRYVPWWVRQGLLSGIEKDGPLLIVALAQAQNQMLVVDDSRRRDCLNGSGEEHRLRIATPKRLQHFVPTEKVVV